MDSARSGPGRCKPADCPIRKFFANDPLIDSPFLCPPRVQVTRSLRAKIQLMLATFPLLSERPCTKITSLSQCYPSQTVSVLLFLLIIITCLILAIHICKRYNISITELD